MDSSHLKKRIEAIEAMPPLREVISDFSLNAQKSLGQNFLLDMNITDKIVREAMRSDVQNWDSVHALEVGPGPGGLTRALLKSPAKTVNALELDHRAVAALEGLSEAALGDLNIIGQDALKVDLTAIVDAPRVIVANLPYNIATPLLINWLKQIRNDSNAYRSMTLMFQKEVADRICAAPNTKAYGRLAVIAQWLCDVHVVYDLPPSAFTPPPKVMSSVVHFIPKKILQHTPCFKAVEQATASAFNQRRKMVRSSLKSYSAAFSALNIEPEKRAENLTVSDYIRLADFDFKDRP